MAGTEGIFVYLTDPNPFYHQSFPDELHGHEKTQQQGNISITLAPDASSRALLVFTKQHVNRNLGKNLNSKLSTNKKTM